MLYNPTKVVVACSQREKLQYQINQKHLSVKIDLKDTTPADTLLLTRGQIASIEKARQLGRRRYKTIRMSKKQIEKNRTHHGGYLSLLDDYTLTNTTLPTLDANNDGLYLIKKGHCMKIYPVQDGGLYLKTCPALNGIIEDGLYMQHDNVIEKGEEIIFAKDSPFTPILGWLLL